MDVDWLHDVLVDLIDKGKKNYTIDCMFCDTGFMEKEYKDSVHVDDEKKDNTNIYLIDVNYG